MRLFGKINDKFSEEIHNPLGLETVDGKIPIPPKPILYGNKFKIKISTSDKASSMANALHNISIFGIYRINASTDIANFIAYHLNKMSKQFYTETLEKLADDYSCLPELGNQEYCTISFELNKQQTIEFMELIEKASQGVSI